MQQKVPVGRSPKTTDGQVHFHNTFDRVICQVIHHIMCLTRSFLLFDHTNVLAPSHVCHRRLQFSFFLGTDIKSFGKKHYSGLLKS